MTLTKAAGALFGALLVFLLGKWAADTLYHVQPYDEAAYVIDTGADEAEDEAEPEVTFAEMLASADADSGSRVFKKCTACHKLEEGQNSTGPYLYGVVGRDVASVEGFGYSDAMKAVDGIWSPEKLSHYLIKPSADVPGTTMSFAGLSKAKDRVDLIAFLNENSDEPYVIEAAAEEAPAEEAAEETAPEEVATEDEPVEEAAIEEAPAEEAVTEEAPAEEVTEEAPAEEVVTEEAPAEEVVTEEAPAEEAVTEEAPAEEVTEEAPADEAPAEEVAEPEASEDAAAAEPAAGAGILASADLEKGARVYKKCAACHKVEEGKNVVGPYLYGVVNRAVASAEGFNYSDAMKDFGGEWTFERLDAYLEKPSEYIPGNKMSFAGLRKEEDRINVIGYLDSLDN